MLQFCFTKAFLLLVFLSRRIQSELLPNAQIVMNATGCCGRCSTLVFNTTQLGSQSTCHAMFFLRGLTYAATHEVCV